MGVRRKARELALKAVFEMDFSQIASERVLARIREEHKLDNDVYDFLKQLLDAYEVNSLAVNQTIERFSNNWKLSRMASVDRNILRLGVIEIVYLADIPKNVTINEYLEVAKKYGTEESSSFVNGILDKINPTP
ncbi:MAG: transcription antitermination factor NusB [uncultured bacterium]|nr:MAG: transcription antitermination factor NusB [uncultured bacterium]